jgi:hypothetical protein
MAVVRWTPSESRNRTPPPLWNFKHFGAETAPLQHIDPIFSQLLRHYVLTNILLDKRPECY